MATLHINSDNVVELRGLVNAITRAVLTAATVTVTLKAKSGAAVSGVSWPIAMPHVANGTYRAILPNELILSNSIAYVATVVADNGADQHREWCVNYSVVCS